MKTVEVAMEIMTEVEECQPLRQATIRMQCRNISLTFDQSSKYWIMI